MIYVNLENVKNSFGTFHGAEPFPYCVIDKFFTNEIAEQLAREFPNSESNVFNGNYFNQIEIKRTCNIWDRFPSTTYNVLQYLNSAEFLDFITLLTGGSKLYADHGLHGGGWHIHPPGGKLNVHLDYSIHPKMKLQRKYNLLVYLNPNYQSVWGGELGLWEGTDKPKELVRILEPKFNQAIIFDTTCNSWHGLEVPNKFPKGQDRKSIALYYLIDPPTDINERSRALFSPSKDQENDQEVLDLIDRRSKVTGQDPTQWDRA
jgi:Rps23 Pro-64 3,4-dihydroxylase Tpa1-like proline 4-hydroxylase